jgi:hypothetical protein
MVDDSGKRVIINEGTIKKSLNPPPKSERPPPPSSQTVPTARAPKEGG